MKGTRDTLAISCPFYYLIIMLSDSKIRQAKPKDKRYKLNDYDGLFILIQPKPKSNKPATKIWRFRYTKNKKTNEMSLGVYPAVSLADARLKVAEYRKLLAQGIDPKANEEQGKAEGLGKFTFSAVSRDWLTNAKRDISEGHRETIQQRLKSYILPTLGNRDMRELRTNDILELVNAIVGKGHVETARRVQGIIGEVFRYGVLSNRCEFDITAPLKGYVKKTEVIHQPTLIEANEIAGMLRAIWGYQGQARTVYALRLSAYTFCRPKEIRLAEWSEIDFSRAVWEIPKEKMKMRRAHIVPLAPQALEVLQKALIHSEGHKYVFASPRKDKELGLSENAANGALRRLGYENQMVAHGFRGMASTILHEQGYDPLHIEMQLAHVESNQVKAAYNHAEYLEQRRKMMCEYADHLDSLRNG